ncbi:MAG: alpha/beta hydrolase family protein [Acidobacteriota bacterium]
MSLYKNWMFRWEKRLTLRDANRSVFPFDWGVEWLGNGASPPAPENPLARFKEFARDSLANSHDFYSPPEAGNFTLKDDLLSFSSPTPTPYPKNNTAYGRLFPARDRTRAVILVPQWNSDENSHVGLCRIFQKMGINAVRLTLPYHEQRLPPGMKRADFMVSPNIGRTIHATRQAILELRQIVHWLRREGYERIGVMGTSLGSCVAYLAFIHDRNISTGVFNHVSAFFADAVWTGLSTRYVRSGLEGNISLEDLRRCWAPISPWYFIEQLENDDRPHLLINAKYDLTFLPELTQLVFDRYAEKKIRLDRAVLPCGHYTTARFPFNYLDGWHICRYLQRRLRLGEHG